MTVKAAEAMIAEMARKIEDLITEHPEWIQDIPPGAVGVTYRFDGEAWHFTWVTAADQ